MQKHKILMLDKNMFTIVNKIYYIFGWCEKKILHIWSPSLISIAPP